MVHVHNELRQGCGMNKYWSLCDFIKTYNVYIYICLFSIDAKLERTKCV